MRNTLKFSVFGTLLCAMSIIFSNGYSNNNSSTESNEELIRKVENVTGNDPSNPYTVIIDKNGNRWNGHGQITKEEMERYNKIMREKKQKLNTNKYLQNNHNPLLLDKDGKFTFAKKSNIFNKEVTIVGMNLSINRLLINKCNELIKQNKELINKLQKYENLDHFNIVMDIISNLTIDYNMNSKLLRKLKEKKRTINELNELNTIVVEKNRTLNKTNMELNKINKTLEQKLQKYEKLNRANSINRINEIQIDANERNENEIRRADELNIERVQRPENEIEYNNEFGIERVQRPENEIEYNNGFGIERVQRQENEIQKERIKELQKSNEELQKNNEELNILLRKVIDELDEVMENNNEKQLLLENQRQNMK